MALDSLIKVCLISVMGQLQADDLDGCHHRYRTVDQAKQHRLKHPLYGWVLFSMVFNGLRFIRISTLKTQESFLKNFQENPSLIRTETAIPESLIKFAAYLYRSGQILKLCMISFHLSCFRIVLAANDESSVNPVPQLKSFARAIALALSVRQTTPQGLVNLHNDSGDNESGSTKRSLHTPLN